jgi:hypothetical protein
MKLQDLFGMLSIINCDGLEGKPKIWLVQACRKDVDPFVSRETDADPVGDLNELKLGADHDYLVAYATCQDEYAYRTVFFSHMLDIVKASDAPMELSWVDLISLANDSMAREYIGSTHKIGSTQKVDTLRGFVSQLTPLNLCLPAEAEEPNASPLNDMTGMAEALPTVVPTAGPTVTPTKSKSLCAVCYSVVQGHHHTPLLAPSPLTARRILA